MTAKTNNAANNGSREDAMMISTDGTWDTVNINGTKISRRMDNEFILVHSHGEYEELPKGSARWAAIRDTFFTDEVEMALLENGLRVARAI